MNLQEAKQKAQSLQKFVGSQLNNGHTAKVIIPIPQNVFSEELKTYCSAYLIKKDIDFSAKLTQTENNSFDIGVLTSDTIKSDNIGIGLFSTYFPEE